MTPVEVTAPRGGTRRAGRRKVQVLEAAGRVIAERGADATRFADVAAESEVPVSTLQYYFGSREDLLVAAFRHASGTEIAALEAELAALSDPWDRLASIVTRALGDYQPETAAWRRLVADAVRSGIDSGRFSARQPPDRIAVLTIALVDGVGIPLALGDPEITPAGAIADVMAALAQLLRPQAARARDD